MSPRSRHLAGKAALVTGGARRIGREIVLALAGAGAAVAIHVRESGREGEALAKRVERAGGRAVVLRADLRGPKACVGLVAETIAALGRLDVLVNNAAVFERTPADVPDAALFDAHVYDEIFEVNVRPVWLLSAAGGRWMKRHGGGAIVNLACTSAFSPWPSYLPYSASKAAVVNLTRGFAKALAPKVRVNAIAPGPILAAKGASAKAKTRAVAATVMKRWGDPKDVARAVVFLAAEARFTTGAVLPVDGGRTLL